MTITHRVIRFYDSRWRYYQEIQERERWNGGPGWKIDQEFNSIQHDKCLISWGPSPN